MSHETGWLSSDWSQPPHRNPAGIGVTGEPGVGCSFSSWPRAIDAHLGRLIAYARRDDELRDDPAWPQAIREQQSLRRYLVDVALKVRSLPTSYRGAYRTIGSLGGTWAVPGHNYGAKLASICNELL